MDYGNNKNIFERSYVNLHFFFFKLIINIVVVESKQNLRMCPLENGELHRHIEFSPL